MCISLSHECTAFYPCTTINLFSLSPPSSSSSLSPLISRLSYLIPSLHLSSCLSPRHHLLSPLGRSLRLDTREATLTSYPPQHSGNHHHIGAVDLLPFHPLGAATMQEAAAVANKVTSFSMLMAIGIGTPSDHGILTRFSTSCRCLCLCLCLSLYPPICFPSPLSFAAVVVVVVVISICIYIYAYVCVYI